MSNRDATRGGGGGERRKPSYYLYRFSPIFGNYTLCTPPCWQLSEKKQNHARLTPPTGKYDVSEGRTYNAFPRKTTFFLYIFFLSKHKIRNAPSFSSTLTGVTMVTAADVRPWCCCCLDLFAADARCFCGCLGDDCLPPAVDEDLAAPPAA